jgi:putative glutamine amidotransferase
MQRIAISYGNPRKAPPYADAVRDAGAEPVLICAADGVRSLDGFAGLMLAGGSDINPKVFGQSAETRTHPPDDARDGLELALLAEALERDLPVLAICRGLQLFNVAHPGGTLYQHIDGHEMRTADPSLPAHTVTIEPGTTLAEIAGASELPVNSRHHQAVSRLGDTLVIAARAPDGIVEAIERPGKRFALAVQWHPEDQQRFAPHRRLLEAFTAACR